MNGMEGDEKCAHCHSSCLRRQIDSGVSQGRWFAMARPPLHALVIGTMLEILSYLSYSELYTFGSSCRRNFMLFLREREARKATLVSSSRFLPLGWKRESVALVSYPRSGNSFLRRLLEKWSGTITGTDSRPNRTLSASLLRCGFRGEGVTDDSVWLVKTHYPERLGYAPFVANRAVLIIRNPFDTIESYFHMGMTNTHDKSLSPEAFKELQHIWEAFIINEIKIWQQFYRYWLSDARVISSTEWSTVVSSKQSEMIVIRYEDLLLHKERVLPLLYSYLGSEGLPPIGLQFSIESMKSPPPTTSASEKEPGYLPRQSGSVGKSLYRYSKSQVQAIYSLAGDSLMSSFGYDVCYTKDAAGVVTDTSGVCERETWLKLKPMDLTLLNSQGVSDSDSDSKERLNTKELSDAHRMSNYSAEGRLIVNSPYSLRTEDDQFGRKITFLRKSLTSNDTKPFATL